MKLVLILAFYVMLGSSVGLLYENTVSPTPEPNVQQDYVKKYDEFITKGSLTETEMEQLRQLSREYEEYEDDEGVTFPVLMALTIGYIISVPVKRFSELIKT